MRNRFTITIQDIHGVKQYTLHQIVKRIAFYAAAALATLIMAGVFVIVYLNDSVGELEAKRENLMVQYEALQRLNGTTEEMLQVKQVELSVVSDRLGDIEELIGIAPASDIPLLERADLAQLTSAQMALLLRSLPNGSPVEYRGITSKFGYRQHPTLGKREYHRGSDLKAAMNTPVHATADAVVEYADFHKKSGYGRLIILDHNFGFRTFYGHLKKIAVESGQFVRKGELIGYTGSSGMSNGPHLHYEVRFIQRTLNPYWFIKWNVENFREIFEKEKRVPWQSLITAITHRHQPVPAPPSSPTVLLSKAN